MDCYEKGFGALESADFVQKHSSGDLRGEKKVGVGIELRFIFELKVWVDVFQLLTKGKLPDRG